MKALYINNARMYIIILLIVLSVFQVMDFCFTMTIFDTPQYEINAIARFLMEYRIPPLNLFFSTVFMFLFLFVTERFRLTGHLYIFISMVFIITVNIVGHIQGIMTYL